MVYITRIIYTFFCNMIFKLLPLALAYVLYSNVVDFVRQGLEELIHQIMDRLMRGLRESNMHVLNIRFVPQ